MTYAFLLLFFALKFDRDWHLIFVAVETHSILFRVEVAAVSGDVVAISFWIISHHHIDILTLCEHLLGMVIHLQPQLMPQQSIAIGD